MSCRKENFTDDPGAKLNFSTDTLHFDTVFVTVGSATRNFKIKNQNKQALRISRIYLAGGENSQFRINIDGRATTEFKDYEIAAGDSIYFFVEVTVDPNAANLPFIISDSVMFEVNGNTQRVILDAFGQNAHFITGEVLGNCDAHWFPDLPYVIYGSMGIAGGCKLTIEPGVKVYSHQGSAMFVGGTLVVNGTKEQPVIFQGDRLEPNYANEAGQWYGIRFLPKSMNNFIQHAEIKNAVIGIEVDSLPSSPTLYNLRIEKSIIKNMALAGIVGYTAAIDVRNSLVHSCAGNIIAAALGGNYAFTNCTFDNTQNVAIKKEASIWLNNSNYKVPEQGINLPSDLKAEFRNCIIWGSLEDEVKIVNDGEGAFDTLFTYNIIKAKEVHFSPDNKLNEFPHFVGSATGDYHLEDFSQAIDYGFPFPPPFNVADDIENNPRINNPDLGCYEKK